MIDVSRVIHFFACLDAELEQDMQGEYDEFGRYQENTRQRKNIKISLHPLSGRMLEDMKEGVRNEAKHRCDSIDDIGNDDYVYVGDKCYRVLHKWPTSSGSYSRVALGLKHNE